MNARPDPAFAAPAESTESTDAAEPVDADVAAGGELDCSVLEHLLGWHVTLADIATRRVFVEHIGKPLGLRPVEFTVLLLVASNAGATQKQLAQALAMSAPNLTILIDRMAEKGLFTRVRSATDRRAQNVHPTAEGAELAARAAALSRGMESRLLGVLSAGERTLLLELLQKVARQRRD